MHRRSTGERCRAPVLLLHAQAPVLSDGWFCVRSESLLGVRAAMSGVLPVQGGPSELWQAQTVAQWLYCAALPGQGGPFSFWKHKSCPESVTA